MERKLTLKLSLGYAMQFANKCMSLPGVEGIVYILVPDDLESFEFTIRYYDTYTGDHWFAGVLIGTFAMESLNAYKFGIKLNLSIRS